MSTCWAPGGGQAVKSKVSAGTTAVLRVPPACRVQASRAALRADVLAGGVHLHAAGTGLVRPAHGDQDAYGTLLGHDQGRLDHQLVQHSAADLVTGPYGEFDQTGAGYEHHYPRWRGRASQGCVRRRAGR